MKLASIISSALLGASAATACGGIETISNPLGAGDAGGSSEPPQQGSSSGGAPGAARADAGMPAFNVSCQGTQSCPPSQVCCATLSFGTGTGGVDVACARSCAPGAYQICATSAECTTSGDVCTPSPLGIGSYCAARGRPDGGALVDGGAHDASPPLDGEVTLDAGSNDSAIVDATGVDATVDTTGVDATVDAIGGDATLDASGGDATLDASGVDATSPDATGFDAPGDDAADDGSADDDSSD
jgi:hypothetical protein